MILDILNYGKQMLPMGLAAFAVFLLLRPVRIRRLERLELVSPGLREAALALFVVFCAGLAALTLPTFGPTCLTGYSAVRLIFVWFGVI